MMTEIDFHAHILPKCDHGSRNIETSVLQLKKARATGIEIVCATPHFYPQKENLDDFLKRREECFRNLRNAYTDDVPKILLGAEVLCCAGLQKMDGLSKLCLEGTSFLLLEMPFTTWNEKHFQTVYEINSLPDITVVLAHIDRYKNDDVECLLRDGIKGQLNADSLAKTFNFKKRRFEKWIENGDVIALGSDIHGADRGYQSWLKAKKRLYTLYKNLMPEINAEAVL